MKPTILVLVLAFLLGLNANAQTFTQLSQMTNGNNNENHMVIDRFGNTYITFTYNDMLLVDGLDFYAGDYWTSILLKFNADGSLIWGYSFTGSNAVTIESIALDKGDGVVVAGSFFDTLYLGGNEIVSNGSDDGILVGFSAEGNIRYYHTFGSNLSDGAAAVCMDKAGNKFVIGQAHNPVTIDGETITPVADQYASFIIKYNKLGVPVDVIPLNNTTTINNSTINVDNKGNVIISGSFYNELVVFGQDLSNSAANFFVAKLTPAMELAWTNVFPIGGFTLLRDVKLDKAGNPYLLFLIDTLTIDGNTFYNSNIDESFFESVLCKINKNTGLAKWANKINSYTHANAYELAINNLQNIAVVGTFKDYINYGTMELTNVGTDLWDGFVLMVDPDGNALNLFDLGDDTHYDELWNVAFDNNSDLHLYGTSSDGMQIGDFTVESAAFNTYWLTTIDFGTYKSATPNSTAEFSINPNPASDQVTLTFAHVTENPSVLQIFDLTGRIVYTTTVNAIDNDAIQINVSNLCAGTYIVQYNNQQQQLMLTK